ncbi:MAG: cysteine desulfurase, partial [bacterium]|nr:cysteine desulfurase [bacterium]
PVYKTLLCEVVRTDGEEPAERPHRPAEPAERSAPERVDAAAATSSRRVYLDHNATAPVDPEVLDAMLPYLTEMGGNPSSIHRRGNEARIAVEAARRRIAQALNSTARRVVFTGSGSEADNLAIKGVALARRDDGRHIVTTCVEHPAVLATCRALEQEGFAVTYLEVDHRGLVAAEALAAALRPDTILVSVMLANNEVGTVQPVAELARVARARGVLFHTDAVQGLGKVPLDVEELGVDLLAISAHKVHGPKGVGALYVRKGVELEPLVHGGGQEHRLRSGTENVPGIVGFGKACELAQRRLGHGEMDRVAALRDQLEAAVRELVPEAKRNGHPQRCLPNTLNMTLPGIRGESLVLLLDRRGLYFSSGSACKAGNPEPSHALTAMGLSVEDAHCAVRFSLGRANTGEDVGYVRRCLAETLRDTRSAIRFVGCR